MHTNAHNFAIEHVDDDIDDVQGTSWAVQGMKMRSEIKDQVIWGDQEIMEKDQDVGIKENNS